MNLTLYFLRHGQTAASRSNAFCGSIDPELTPEGQEMAQEFAAAYSEVRGDLPVILVVPCTFSNTNLLVGSVRDRYRQA